MSSTHNQPLIPQQISEEEIVTCVLRIHEEPYRYFDDRQVHAMLCAAPQLYLQHLLEQLTDIASGLAHLELPDKLIFRDGDAFADFRVMPCVVTHPHGRRKIVKIIGTNEQRIKVPDQITVGKAFAIDATENFIEAGFAGCLLSSARTGACAAIANHLLATSRERLSIFGCGRVGYYAAFFIAASGNVSSIMLHDVERTRAVDVARLLQLQFPDIDIQAVEQHGVDTPDIAVLATDSIVPFYGATHPLPPLTISLGADTDWQHELDPSIFDGANIFIDTFDSLHYGDLRALQTRSQVDHSAFTDLLNLIRSPQRRRHPAVFISTGSALFDNLTIDYLLRNEHALRSHQAEK